MKILLSIAVILVTGTASLSAAPPLVKSPTPGDRAGLLGAVKYPSFDLSLTAELATGDFSPAGGDPALRLRELAGRTKSGKASPEELAEYAVLLVGKREYRKARMIRLRALRKYEILEKSAAAPASYLPGLAGLLLEMGDYQRAVACYLKAIKLSPRDSSLHVSLATAYGFQQDWARAGKAMNKALSIAGKDPDVYLKYQFLYRMRFLSFPPEYMRRLFLNNRILTQYNLKAIDMALSFKPKDYRLLFFRRYFSTEFFFFRLKMTTDARALRSGKVVLSARERALLEENGRFYRKALSNRRLPYGKIIRILAVNQLCLGETESAESLLRAAVRKDPGDWKLQDGLYAIMQLRGDYPGFVKAVEAAVRNSGGARNLLILGKIRYRAGSFDGALSLIRKAIASESGSGKSYLALAAVKVRQGKLADAVAAIGNVDRNAPEYAEALLALARINLARKDPAGAFAALDRLLKQNPSHTEGRKLAEEWFGLR